MRRRSEVLLSGFRASEGIADTVKKRDKEAGIG